MLILSVFTLPAGAQKQPLEADSCVYRIPAKAFKRVPVLLQATADSASSAILQGADFFAQSVAFKLRDLAGGSDTQLADADSVIWWGSLSGEVRVTAHRAGSLTWKVPEWASGADTLRRSALAALRDAIEQVSSSGETVMIPEGFAGDSVSFGLSLIHPTVTKEGKIVPVRARQPIPVFTIGVPWEEPVEPSRNADVKYPELSRSLSSIGNVQLAFAVDRNGRVDTATVKEIWPANLERPTGSMLRSYEAFLAAVKRALPSARFSPATIGGCPTKQMVSQTFEFLLSGARR